MWKKWAMLEKHTQRDLDGYVCSLMIISFHQMTASLRMFQSINNSVTSFFFIRSISTNKHDDWNVISDNNAPNEIDENGNCDSWPTPLWLCCLIFPISSRSRPPTECAADAPQKSPPTKYDPWVTQKRHESVGFERRLNDHELMRRYTIWKQIDRLSPLFPSLDI